MRVQLTLFVLVLIVAGSWWLIGRDTSPEDLVDRTTTIAPTTPTAATAAVGGVPGADESAASRVRVAPDEAERGEGTLAVFVVLDDGSALPHVAVRAIARDGRQQLVSQRLAVTGDDGAVLFEGLAAGAWQLQLDRNVEADVHVRAGERSEHRFTVPRGLTALARVIDGTGQRIPGATVTLWSASGYLDAPSVHRGEEIGATNSNGELLLRGLPQFGGHGCWLAAHHPGFGSSPARMVASAADEQDTATRVVELRLGLSGAFLTVQVDASNQQPVPDAFVELAPIDRPGSRDDGSGRVVSHLLRTGRTDTRGRTVLGPLANGDYRFEVVCAGFERFRAPMRIDDEQPRTRTVVLETEARVRARITGVDGKPIEGVDFHVQVEPSGGRAASGPDGTCELGGLSPGSAVFVTTHPRFVEGRGAVELVRGITIELPVTLQTLPTISGRLVDDAGQPLAGVGLRATAKSNGDDEDQRNGVSAADGGFAIPANAGLDYRLTVFEPGTSIPLLGIDPALVHVREEPWVVQVPRDARASAFLEGLLVDGDSRPAIADRHLSVLGDSFQVHPGSTMTAPELDATTGRFRIGPLPPGTYTLSIGGQPTFTVKDIVLRARATTQLGQVVVPESGTLRVEVAAAQGLRVADVLVEVDGNGDSDIFQIGDTLTGSRQLLPGHYRVVVYGTGFRWLEQEVDITARAVSTVRGELRPAVRVGLRFCMPAGEHGASFTITDGSGAVATTHELADGVASEDLWPFFEIGTFTVAITGSSGKRYRTQFAVESLERNRDLRELRGEPVR